MPIWRDVTKPKKPKRKAGQRRFENIKVGDQLVSTYMTPHYDNRNERWDDRRVEWYWIVTDLWFDPVAGQDNRQSGEMVGIAQIDVRGMVRGRKRSHTIRGLASQGYRYSPIDYIAQQKAVIEAHKDGKIVGIGFGRTIRQRPKLPGL